MSSCLSTCPKKKANFRDWRHCTPTPTEESGNSWDKQTNLSLLAIKQEVYLYAHPMEILPIVHEESGELTGVCLPRHEVIAQSAWCQTTNIFVMNAKNEILCHKRSSVKERMPGVWMTHVGGHVGQDEDFDSNALKELSEEAGIDATAQELIHWRTTRIPSARVWVREYVILKDLPVESLIPQPGEVDQFAWFKIEEILQNFQTEPHNWCVGTHDFYVEYHCLRAALTAAQHTGAINPSSPLHSWHPLARLELGGSLA